MNEVMTTRIGFMTYVLQSVYRPINTWNLKCHNLQIRIFLYRNFVSFLSQFPLIGCALLH